MLLPEPERLAAMDHAEGWPMVLIVIAAAIVIHALLSEPVTRRSASGARLQPERRPRRERRALP
jgi:hypothetical protein